MIGHFFKSVSFLGWVLCLVSAAAALLVRRADWGAGILTGSSWIYLNLYFLFQLMESGMNPGRSVNKKDRILLLAVLKFPVLYMAGYFVLKSRTFPTMSLLTGLTVFSAALVLVWMRFGAGDETVLEKKSP